MSDTPETNALLKQCKIKGRNPDPWKLCRKLERERDEALEAFSVATGQLVQAQEALREIAAADWKTSGELRGMAKRALQVKK